jgi:hypothetical protein
MARYLYGRTAAKRLMQCGNKEYLKWLNAFILRSYWTPPMEKCLEHKTRPNIFHILGALRGNAVIC